jgi:hypothetical protein
MMLLVDQHLPYDELQHNMGLPNHDSDVEVNGKSVIGQHYNDEDKKEESDAEHNPHALFQSRPTASADHFDGAFTHAEKLSIRLLAIMRCIGAPNAANGEIMAIMLDALLGLTP